MAFDHSYNCQQQKSAISNNNDIYSRKEDVSKEENNNTHNYNNIEQLKYIKPRQTQRTPDFFDPVFSHAYSTRMYFLYTLSKPNFF